MPENVRREAPAMGHPDHDFDHRWHVAINKATERWRSSSPPLTKREDASFMYEAKAVAGEVPRLARLFQMERDGKLSPMMQVCSHSAPVPVPENYLTCCLGKRCRDCPFLGALDEADMSDAERDHAKAWTCATHIIASGGDIAREGYILTVDDRMYWDRTYALMAGADHAD